METKQEVWAEWSNGKQECVDSAESEAEALYLLNEYRAERPDARRFWLQLSDNNNE